MPERSFRLPSREEAGDMLKRLGAAKRGSPELDVEVRSLLGLPEALTAFVLVTVSLDAALDLIEVVLPGWSVDMQTNRIPHERDAGILKPGSLFVSTSAPRSTEGYSAGFEPVTVPAVGATRALSALCAMFDALASSKFDVERNLPSVRTEEPGVTPGMAPKVVTKLLMLTVGIQRQVIRDLGLDRVDAKGLTDVDFLCAVVRRARETNRLVELDRAVDAAVAGTEA